MPPRESQRSTGEFCDHRQFHASADDGPQHAGLALGLAAAMGLTRLLAGLLFGVRTRQ